MCWKHLSRILRSAGLSALLTLLLAGCVTSTAYQPAAEPDDFGYRQVKLTQSHYRISFAGNNQTARETVELFALYRAAEATLEAGRQYFRIISQQSSPITQTYGDRVSLGGGYGWGFHPWGVGAGYGTGVRSATRYESVLEIDMAADLPHAGADIYNARQVQDNLRDRVRASQQH